MSGVSRGSRKRAAAVSAWRRSGLTAEAFAPSLGVHAQTLRAWGRAEERGREARSVEVVEVSGGLVAGAPVAASRGLAVEVELRNGRRLAVVGELSPRDVAAIAVALEGAG